MSSTATWALLQDIRARIAAYDAESFCPRPIGQAVPSARQHKLVEIIDVGPTSRLDDTFADRTALSVTRVVLIQAFYSIGSDDAQLNSAEEDAGRWFDGLREALINYTGDGWSRDRKIRFLGEPVTLGREGSYLFYQLQFATEVPITVGTNPVPST